MLLSQARSRHYNAGIRLATVRHAMLGQLRHPPRGDCPLLSFLCLFCPPSLPRWCLNINVLALVHVRMCCSVSMLLTVFAAFTHDSLPTGFEDIVSVHFTIQREALLLQLSGWLRECASPDEERKLRRAVDQLRNALEKI